MCSNSEQYVIMLKFLITLMFFFKKNFISYLNAYKKFINTLYLKHIPNIKKELN